MTKYYSDFQYLKGMIDIIQKLYKQIKEQMEKWTARHTDRWTPRHTDRHQDRQVEGWTRANSKQCYNEPLHTLPHTNIQKLNI